MAKKKKQLKKKAAKKKAAKKKHLKKEHLKKKPTRSGLKKRRPRRPRAGTPTGDLRIINKIAPGGFEQVLHNDNPDWNIRAEVKTYLDVGFARNTYLVPLLDEVQIWFSTTNYGRHDILSARYVAP